MTYIAGMLTTQLSSEELERYARHIVLREVGGPGQAALRRARVLVVGAGGLGAPVLLYLAAAGVGTLGVVDDDVVSLSNLQRQVIHGTPDIGAPKIDSAAATIRRLNPHVAVEQHGVRLTAKNALDLIGGYDIVADGSDNFATRYLVSDACYFANKPLVTAALGTFDGTLTTIRAHERGADGKPNPTYRCLFPEPPPPGTVPACAEAGVLGALAGVIGSMMALEVIREIVGFGEGLVGRLVMLDARAMRFETLRYGWDPENPLIRRAPDDPRSVGAQVTTSADTLLAIAPGYCSGHLLQVYLLHVAMMVEPLSTDHLLSPALMTVKQLAPAFFHVVQKPSFDSFHVPSPLPPPPLAAARFILPSAVNVILNLTLELVAAVNGWPVKNVDWMASGASFDAGGAANAGVTRINAAAPPKTPAM